MLTILVDENDLVPIPSLRQIVSNNIPDSISLSSNGEQISKPIQRRFRSDSPPATHCRAIIRGNFPHRRKFTSESETELFLDFVYGYNGRARNNIAWNPDVSDYLNLFINNSRPHYSHIPLAIC